jgi:L-aminopeptidase/D-esterase-like protein
MRTDQKSDGIKTPGIKIGHQDDPVAITGCTVILCEDGAVCGLEKRGGATTTRQADAFEPWHVVQEVHGLLLTGGSAFGLGALSGVLQYLEEQGVGFDMRVARVPIAAAAGLFDLGIGDATVRPSPEMAYQACLKANSNRPEEGCVGAGMGATVGKILGIDFAMKSGIGWHSESLDSGLVVEAIAAVNPGGDVVDPASGQIVAGVRSPDPGNKKLRENYFADAQQLIKSLDPQATPGNGIDSTVIGAVLTNAILDKVQATKVAQMAQDGLARSVRPIHTMYDGDTIFTLATCHLTADVNLVGSLAAEVFGQAVVRAVLKAKSMGGLPAVADIPGNYE